LIVARLAFCHGAFAAFTFSGCALRYAAMRHTLSQ
jgi:hypothetical protein